MTVTRELARQLQGRIRGLEKSPQAPAVEEWVASGCLALDRLLPERGWRRGAIVEWLSACVGSGAATLALLGARQACQDGGVLVLVDRPREVYPPALAAWGVDLERVILLYPETARDEFWAWDQALRCPGVAAVWGWLEQLDGRRFRRLQLSAEASGVLGMLLRPAQVCRQPTWAEVRLWVEPQPELADASNALAAGSGSGRRLRVKLLHARGGGHGEVTLTLDEWTGELREGREPRETHTRDLAAQLARATACRRATGTGGTSGRTL